MERTTVEASHKRKPRLRCRELTAREEAVLSRVLAGSSSKQIAQELQLSPKTVETYRARAMRKLQAESRSDLARHGPKVLTAELPRDQLASICSPRELVVLRMAAEGRTTAQTAQALGVKVCTVWGYHHAIYRKLGVRNMVGALIIWHKFMADGQCYV